MSVFSFQFVVGALFLAAMFFYVPGTAARRAVFTAFNILFIALCLPSNPSRILLAIFVISGYVVGLLLRRRPSGIILGAYLFLFVAAFGICKKYILLHPLLPAWVWDYPIIVVGLSYLLFRQIHFLTDMMQHQIETYSFYSYVNYQLNLFGFLAGPIQRYQDFQQTWQNWDLVLTTRQDISMAYFRFFLGLGKIAASTAVFWLFSREKVFFLLDPTTDFRPPLKVLGKFLVMLYSYPVYLYLNFSGYCDVVIAAGALVGLRMPENFDRPYLSRNMLDYWTRFHRTLGFWIRDYLFTPLYKNVAERWNSHAATLVFPCYFIAFVLAGIWHGSTLNFAVFGVLHGSGAAATKIWDYQIVKRTGRKGLKKYLQSKPIEIAAITVTLTYVAITMLFFPHDLPTTRAVMSHFFHRIGV